MLDRIATCEAVTRPSMRFVATKSEPQQSGLMLHRSRQLLVCQRTMLSNAIRGHLAELGIIAAKGRNGTGELLKIIADEPAAQQYRGVLFLSFKHGRRVHLAARRRGSGVAACGARAATEGACDWVPQQGGKNES
jgi:transposase